MITSINSNNTLDVQRYEGLKPQIPRNKEVRNEAPSKLVSKPVEAEQETKTISEQVQELKKKKEEDAFARKDFDEFENKINEALQVENLKIEFSKDDESKRMIMRLIDKETQEVVHQYPPDITLKIARIVANTLEQGSLTNAIV